MRYAELGLYKNIQVGEDELGNAKNELKLIKSIRSTIVDWTVDDINRYTRELTSTSIQVRVKAVAFTPCDVISYEGKDYGYKLLSKNARWVSLALKGFYDKI